MRFGSFEGLKRTYTSRCRSLVTESLSVCQLESGSVSGPRSAPSIEMPVRAERSCINMGKATIAAEASDFELSVFEQIKARAVNDVGGDTRHDDVYGAAETVLRMRRRQTLARVKKIVISHRPKNRVEFHR